MRQAYGMKTASAAGRSRGESDPEYSAGQCDRLVWYCIKYGFSMLLVAPWLNTQLIQNDIWPEVYQGISDTSCVLCCDHLFWQQCLLIRSAVLLPEI